MLKNNRCPTCNSARTNSDAQINAASAGEPTEEPKMWAEAEDPDLEPDEKPAELGWWLIRYDDADVQPEVFNDEVMALKRYEQAKLSWNCQLFKMIDASPKLASLQPQVTGLRELFEKIIAPQYAGVPQPFLRHTKDGEYFIYSVRNAWEMAQYFYQAGAHLPATPEGGK